MGLKNSQLRAFKQFGKQARDHPKYDQVKEHLEHARIEIRPEVHIANAMYQARVTGIIMGVLGLLSVLILWLFAEVVVKLLPNLKVDYISLLIYGLGALLTGALAGFMTYMIILNGPKGKAKGRGKGINAKLPYATNYIAAMFSAGIVPAEIFKSLASQEEIYGEAAKESAWIYKDIHIHGIDINTAMNRAARRSPSEKWQELIQGAITTISSGGDLQAYFEAKSKRYQWENRTEQKSFIDTMGLMAETYVTAAVAGPLFLLVIVSIIVLMGNGTIQMIQMLVYLLLPVISGAFAFGLKKMIPEV